MKNISKTNIGRSGRGKQILKYYSQLMGDDEYISSPSSVIADLIHYCKQNDIDIYTEIKYAFEFYEDEINGIDDYLDVDN